jgi:hypothetical protein
MANIDYIGWISSDLKAGKVDSGTTSISVARKAPQKSTSRYFIDFGRNSNSAGAYFTRGNGKTYRVNGKKIKEY